MKELYTYTFYFIFTLVFLIGGFLQFFVGIPNTLITYIIVSVLILFYIFYALVKGRVYLNKLTIVIGIFILWILLSAFVNGTNWLKVIIYLVFAFLPLSIYLFFKVNQKENYISQIKISKLFLVIAVIQYPILLLQNYGFDFLISFNKSSQVIASFDFLFGSFFLKADHALGFFLLINILNLIKNNNEREITKFPIFAYIYLSYSVLSSESNVSKLFLIVLFVYFIYNIIPSKVKKIGILVILVSCFMSYPVLKKIEFLNKEIEYMKAEYNPIHSYKNYRAKIAKRAQVVITYATKIPLKLIGDGPYAYYNILKGKFKKTHHFSQLIWTYNDLGLVGVLLVISIIFLLVKDLNLESDLSIFLLSIILVFSFMTTVFTDAAIMISLTSVLKKNRRYERYSSDSVS